MEYITIYIDGIHTSRYYTTMLHSYKYILYIDI